MPGAFSNDCDRARSDLRVGYAVDRRELQEQAAGDESGASISVAYSCAGEHNATAEHRHYVDEDAIAPLWKGECFPEFACISGWVMVHKSPVVPEKLGALSEGLYTLAISARILICEFAARARTGWLVRLTQRQIQKTGAVVHDGNFELRPTRVSMDDPAMPTYQYLCKKCGKSFERSEHLAAHEKAHPLCPKCHSAQVEPVLADFYAKTSKKS